MGDNGRSDPLLAQKTVSGDEEVVEAVPLTAEEKVNAAKAEKRSLCISICALAFSIPALIGA